MGKTLERYQKDPNYIPRRLNEIEKSIKKLKKNSIYYFFVNREELKSIKKTRKRLEQEALELNFDQKIIEDHEYKKNMKRITGKKDLSKYVREKLRIF